MPALGALLTIIIPWNPNIASLGDILLAWHGVFTAVGILAGVQLSLRMGKVTRYNEDEAYSIALVGVPSGIIGARLLYVFEHWDFFASRPLEVLALNEGGISVWGAVIGGVLGGLLFALWRRYDIRGALDIAAFGMLAGLAIGRIGDLINGEHLAKATGLPWGVVYTHPDSPAFAHSLAVGPHHPATTYEMLASFLLLAALFPVLRRLRSRPGLTFFVFLDVYALLRFFVSFLRVDATGATWGLDMPQVISLGVLLLSVPFVIWFWRRPPVAPSSSAGAAPASVRVPVARTDASTPARTRGRKSGDL